MPHRVAFIFPTSACARPINAACIYDDPRGLTGSEVAWWELGQRLRSQDVEVTLFGNFVQRHPGIVPDSEWPDYADEDWDAVASFIQPQPLQLCQPSVRRVFVQQVNDFGACGDDWRSYVDYLLAPSRPLLHHLLAQTDFPAAYTRVLHNGHGYGAPASFPDVKRVPGRILWASSHDRGLAWALEAYQLLCQTFVDPASREFYPPRQLSFHVAYNHDGLESMAGIPPNALPIAMRSMGERSRYCKSTLPKLADQGVRVLGSVSREQMAREMLEAEFLLYPCDPVNWTEGFSNTTCEAMALGCLPILCFSDAFPVLWKGAVPGVDPVDVFAYDGSRAPKMRFYPRRDEYVSIARSLLSGLTVDGVGLDGWRKRAAERASFFHWDRHIDSFRRFLLGDDAALPGPEHAYPWEQK